MLIPQYQVLVLKLSPIYMVSVNKVFLILQNQCYPGTPCTRSWLNLCVLSPGKQQEFLAIATLDFSMMEYNHV
jgi:hypothetical protein